MSFKDLKFATNTSADCEPVPSKLDVEITLPESCLALWNAQIKVKELH